MRLTLRTLLAYLDDTLEPAQAKVIGQKIAESEAAQQLIKRIKEVTRRQDLAVPSTGPDAPVDLNAVAEYLDNVLPPEKAAEVEEVGQNTDVYLAELAACHQILSLLAGEPSKVPQSARERMYALTRGRAAARRAGAAAAAALGAEGSARTGDDAEAMDGEPSALRRFAPLAGALALLAALGIIIWQMLPGATPPKTESQLALVADTGPARPPEVPVTKPAAPPPTTPNTRPAPVKPDPEKPEPEKPKQPIDQPPQDVVSKERKELGKFQTVARAPGSVLVTQPASTAAWEVVAPQAAVQSTQPLVSLPGNRSMVQLDSGVGLLLWGSMPEFLSLESLRQRQEMPVVESKVTLHAPQAPHNADLTLQAGRVVFASRKAEGGGPVQVHLRILDQVWDLALTEPGTEVSVEVCGRYLNDTPFRKQGGGDGPLTEVLLIVLKGEASLKVNYNVFAMPNASAFYWNNLGAAPGGPRPLTQLPDWYTRDTIPEDMPGSRELVAAVQELALRFKAKDAPVAAVLNEFLKDANQGRRVLAIYCLGAIDDLPLLVDCLEDRRIDVRQMTIQTLRHWIGVSGPRDLQLYNLLHDRKGYSEHQAETIMQLLHTFSSEDVARPETYDTLINYLLHETVAIRELAYWHLIRLMPQGSKIPPFDATGNTEQRITAFKAWKALIPDDTVPSRPKG
jgi:hypothetical protein